MSEEQQAINLAEYPLRTAPAPAPDFNRYGRLLIAQASQPWEYLQEEIPQAQWQMRLTELGAEGWELVQQTEVQHMAKLPEESVGKWQAITFIPGWLCFFKRPKGE